MNFHKVGHRGAPRLFPANTLRSFQAAAELGCTMVECDIREAADDVLVLAHDETVTDTGGRAWKLAEHPSAELAALNLGAGEGVPTLTVLVDWCVQTGVALMADMKCEGGEVEEKVVAALASLPPKQKIVPGAGTASRARFRTLDASLPLSLSLGRGAESQLAGEGFATLLAQIETQAVTWEYPLLNPNRIASLHERGLRVYAWTVDDIEIMRRLKDNGVDGIISNRSDLLAVL